MGSFGPMTFTAVAHTCTDARQTQMIQDRWAEVQHSAQCNVHAVQAPFPEAAAFCPIYSALFSVTLAAAAIQIDGINEVAVVSLQRLPTCKGA